MKKLSSANLSKDYIAGTQNRCKIRHFM